LELARWLWHLAGELDAGQRVRDTAATTALDSWRGRFAEQFRESVRAESRVTGSLADQLRADAQTLARLWAEAVGAENNRVRQADFSQRTAGVMAGGSEPSVPPAPVPPAFEPTAALPNRVRGV